MNEDKLAKAIEVIRVLLDLIDSKWLQTAWFPDEREQIEQARRFAR